MMQLHRQVPRATAPAAGPSPPRGRPPFATSSATALSACDGPQSALAPAGRDAETIAGLTGWMVGGAVLVWLLVIGIAVWALAFRPHHRDRDAALLVLGGGVVPPTVVLAVLLVYGLVLMPGLNPAAPPADRVRPRGVERQPHPEAGRESGG